MVNGSLPEPTCNQRTHLVGFGAERGTCGGFGRTKEWDEGRGVWKDRPRHDNASHGADAFLTFACSDYTPPPAYVPRKRILRGIV